MNQRQDVIDFEIWAINLGCPPECIPPKKILDRVFSTGQSFCFLDMMKLVQPKNEVMRLRDQIAVNSISDMKGKMLTNQLTHKLPEQMQRWLKMDKLKKEISETRKEVEEISSEYDKLANVVEEMNLIKMKLKEKRNDLNTKTNVLKLKSNDFREKIKKEVIDGKTIEQICPINVTVENSSNAVVGEAIDKAKNVLMNYYANNNNSNEQRNATDQMDVFWNNLLEKVSEIPNYFLWTKLYNDKKSQVLEMEIMSRENIDKILQIKANNKSAVRLSITKMYAKHICLEAKYRKEIKAKRILDNDYVLMYNETAQKLRSNYSYYNNCDPDDELIDEYMREFCLNSYSQAEISFLQSTLAAIDEEIENNVRVCDDHQLIIKTLQCIYKEIEEIYCDARSNAISMSHVKEKLAASEKSLDYLVQTKTPDPNMSAISLNSSIRTNRCNNYSMTTADLEGSALLPQWSKELKLFVDLPVSKMKEPMLMEVKMDLVSLAGYPDIEDGVNDKSICLQTISSVLKSLQISSKMSKELTSLLKENNSNVNIPFVDFEYYENRKDDQNNAIAQSFDNIAKINAKTLHLLDNINQHVQFKTENPLRKFVPLDKTFNDHNYYEFEREFLMYYKMVESN